MSDTNENLRNTYGPTNQHPVPGGTHEEQVLDDVLDRAAGEDHNPNPADVVAENRKRFDQMNRELKGDLTAAEQAWAEQQELLKQQELEQQHNPAHQAVIPHQMEHNLTDGNQNPAGQSVDHNPASHVDDTEMIPVKGPMSPVEPDREIDLLR